MQKLSAALLDLASRVKRVEDSAAAVEAKNRAKLQARREELEAAIDQSHIEMAAAATQTKESASTKWSAVKNSVEGQVDEMRADFAKWQAEMKEDRAERAAENAEYDAVAAVNLAAYCLDAAEWAAVQAELARGEADQLAGRS
jgi:predicted ATP-binding protein involved in virulence